jgi:dolichol-phosphate mannosyltransferase
MPVPSLSIVIPCYNERDNVAPLVASLDHALPDIDWEVIFVDDNSPDGTADAARAIGASDPRVRCIRRVGRRGLASAVIEGALSAAAPFVAVMDGDGQHDETILPAMLRAVRDDGFDFAVGSRHVEGGDASGLANGFRETLSAAGTRLARRFLPVKLSDPMSGFFLLRRDNFERSAPALTGEGFKILLDLILSQRAPPKVREVGYRFRDRLAGESKLDITVLLQFAQLLLDKTFGGTLPLRFMSFAIIGLLGVAVHLAVLGTVHSMAGFATSQTVATVVAMMFNFVVNNQVTYRERRLRGPALARGLVLFILVCGVGAVANIGIARALYAGPVHGLDGLAAGAIGAAIGVVWNYAVSATLVWRTR